MWEQQLDKLQKMHGTGATTWAPLSKDPSTISMHSGTNLPKPLRLLSLAKVQQNLGLTLLTGLVTSMRMWITKSQGNTQRPKMRILRETLLGFPRTLKITGTARPTSALQLEGKNIWIICIAKETIWALRMKVLARLSIPALSTTTRRSSIWIKL